MTPAPVFIGPLLDRLPFIPRPRPLAPTGQDANQRAPPSFSLYSFQIPYATVSPPPPRHLPMLSIPTPGLRHVPVRGDGRCLFRAIAKGLAWLNSRQLAEGAERADADHLRQVAWVSICKRRRSEFERRHVVEGSMSSYCAASNHPTFYGGEPEMLALADELRIPIAVYLRGSDGRLNNIVTYGEEYYNKLQKLNPNIKHPAIRLLYVNGNHYDALLPKK